MSKFIQPILGAFLIGLGSYTYSLSRLGKVHLILLSNWMGVIHPGGLGLSRMGGKLEGVTLRLACRICMRLC